MLPEVFAPEENIFRAVPDAQYDFNEDKPSTAAFKDSQGLSVDRQWERQIHECKDFILAKDKFANSKAIVHISTETCKVHGANPNYKPEPDNNYHSILIRPDGTIRLSDSTRRKLKENCIVCYKREEDAAPVEAVDNP